MKTMIVLIIGLLMANPVFAAKTVDPFVQKHHVIMPARLPAPSPGTWQVLATPNLFAANALLLTDGTVILQNSGGSDWWKLTPDINGNYATGSLTQIASLPSGYAPTYYASAVLPDGKVAIIGGEYNGGGIADTYQGAIYDPIANSWSNLPWVNRGGVGDAASVVLPSGQWMVAACCQAGDQFLNESTLTWTATGTNKTSDNDEAALNLLPNGTVLTVDTTSNCNNAETYDPNTGLWSPAGVWSSTNSCVGGEIGPTVVRGDGTVVQFGATIGAPDPVGIYNVSKGTWTASTPVPSIGGVPYTLADAPAAMLPNGNILFAASAGNAIYSAPTHFWEFDGVNYTQVGDTPFAAGEGSYAIEFLVLPNGQILANDSSDAIEVYTPLSGQSQPAPTISSAPASITLGTAYTLTGTQLGGLTQGASYGDDHQSYTNYPIVAVVNNATGHVFYAKTYGWPVSIAPRAAGSTNFVLTNAEAGASHLYVSANGVQSAPVAVMISGGGNNPVDGMCGSANGGTFSNAPTTNLCSSGTASTVTGNGLWAWTCQGSNGGAPAQCSAQLQSSNNPTLLAPSLLPPTTLQNALGTWSWGPLARGTTGYYIYLNGGTTYGIAQEMQVGSNGNFFAFTDPTGGSSWWEYTSPNGWMQDGAPSGGTPIYAPSLLPPTTITNSLGTWSWGALARGTTGYYIYLNGQNTQGIAQELEIDGGVLYAFTDPAGGSSWWTYTSPNGWAPSNPPPTPQ